MHKAWPFRSGLNFAITSIGVGFITLTGISMYKERKFSHPIVTESIRLLSTNEQIKDLIGYPIMYHSGSKNSLQIKNGNEYYFHFEIQGSRGSTLVNLKASALPIKDIYTYNEANKGVEAINTQIQQTSKKIIQLKEYLLKNQRDKRQKNSITLELKKNQLALQTLSAKKIEKQRQRTYKKYKYYIPDGAIYDKVIKSISNDSKSSSNDIIPQNTLFWGIDNLNVDLPNLRKINISTEIDHTHTDDSTPEIVKKQIPNFIDVHSRLAKSFINLAPEQIQAYSRHKTQHMYSQYGFFKIIGLSCISIAVITYAFYSKKNKISNIKGTIIEQLICDKFKKNTKINLLGYRMGINFILKQSDISGGVTNNNLSCKINIQGINSGCLQVKGKYLPKQQKILWKSFVFTYLENQQNKSIDLLIQQ